MLEARARRGRGAAGAAAAGVILAAAFAEPASASGLLFVSNANSSTFSGFVIGSSGAPVALSGSPFATGGTFPQGLTVGHQRTPSGSSPAVVDVANFSTANVSAFAVGSGGRRRRCRDRPSPRGRDR